MPELIVPDAGAPAPAPAAPPAAPATPAAAPGAPPATPAAPAAPLVGGGAPAAPPAAPAVPSAWGDDWRDKIAESVKPGDKAFRTRLERFATPADITKSFLALEAKQSSGEVKQALPANATPEQVAAWRKDNGVPEKADDYKIELPNGVVPGEADKPILDAFKAHAHGKNWTPSQVNDALGFYFENQDKQQQQLAGLDAEQRQKTEDSLRLEWGADFRRQTNAVDNFLAAAPDGLGKLLVEGRLADGTRIGNDPRMIRFLNRVATDLNPAATLVPAGMDGQKGVTDRIAEIRKINREDPNKYDSDKALQKEYLDLLEVQSKLRTRAA